jgi:hypothetical protein
MRDFAARDMRGRRGRLGCHGMTSEIAENEGRGF